MIQPTDLGIGDVLCTRSTGWAVFWIRLGAALLDRPNTVNHVIVVHHWDSAGTLWGIEGRPGGVGYVDVKRHLASPYTLTNKDQPKDEGQRFVIAKAAEGLLGTPYDWRGIVEDGMRAIGAQELWRDNWGKNNVPPAHVVCSSFADWLYDHVGLLSPGRQFDRNVTPGDWAKFIVEKEWKNVL